MSTIKARWLRAKAVIVAIAALSAISAHELPALDPVGYDHRKPVLGGDPEVARTSFQQDYFRLPPDVESSLFIYVNLDEHCRPTRPTITVTTAPSHGKVRVAPGSIEDDVLATRLVKRLYSERAGAACSIPSKGPREVLYAPDAGFVGKDSFVLRIVDGRATKEMTVTVNFAPIKSR